MSGDIAARVAAVREAVVAAAGRAGRDPGGIRIVAVTKTLPPDAVRAAVAAGIEDFGENYVQEGRAKRRALGGVGRWHLIGPLQRNKVNVATAVFDRIHTVDSSALAEMLARAATAAGRSLPVLLQVNVAGELGKHGVAVDEVQALAGLVGGLPGLRLEGLMTIPPRGGGEAARRLFRRLREVRDGTADRLGVELPHLSMGMSDDFVVAVEEGATMLRIGRALFGTRGAVAWREDS